MLGHAGFAVGTAKSMSAEKSMYSDITTYLLHAAIICHGAVTHHTLVVLHIWTSKLLRDLIRVNILARTSELLRHHLGNHLRILR